MKGGQSIRGHRDGTPNGMPPLKPYVYRGSKPYEGPDTARQARMRSAGVSAIEMQRDRFADRLVRYLVLRGEGLGVAEAAGRIGVVPKTARRSYEPHWRARCEAAAAEPAVTAGEIAARGETA